MSHEVAEMEAALDGGGRATSSLKAVNIHRQQYSSSTIGLPQERSDILGKVIGAVCMVSSHGRVSPTVTSRLRSLRESFLVTLLPLGHPASFTDHP